ncbi:MAG TPA: hypothetical protein VIF34_10180 [Methylocystis sp.]|jgi:hypothetical protein
MLAPSEKANPGASQAPGPEPHVKNLAPRNIAACAPVKDYLGETLVRAFVIEQADTMGSLAVSFAEATWRGNDALASIHLEQIRLVGRELVRSFGELNRIGGGAQ